MHHGFLQSIGEQNGGIRRQSNEYTLFDDAFFPSICSLVSDAGAHIRPMQVDYAVITPLFTAQSITVTISSCIPAKTYLISRAQHINLSARRSESWNKKTEQRFNPFVVNLRAHQMISLPLAASRAQRFAAAVSHFHSLGEGCN